MKVVRIANALSRRQAAVHWIGSTDPFVLNGAHPIASVGTDATVMGCNIAARGRGKLPRLIQWLGVLKKKR